MPGRLPTFRSSRLPALQSGAWELTRTLSWHRFRQSLALSTGLWLTFMTLQIGDQTLEQWQETRTKLMELNAMSRGQFLKGCGPIATELYEDVAPVLGPIRSFNQFLSGEPIN